MKKVFIITWEDMDCDGKISSGVSYVFNTLEKAEKMLKEIKKDEIQYQIDGGREDAAGIAHDLITENGFIMDYFDEYTKYVIIEEEVK